MNHIIIQLIISFTSFFIFYKNHFSQKFHQGAPKHVLFDELLNRYVQRGKVNYLGFISDSINFKNYLEIISDNPPNNTWSEEEKMVYWINAYNAFTIKLIIDNYPLESITDLHPTLYIPMFNTVWHKKFFSIGKIKMSLDQIEHNILRKQFDDPRIHFAINCASVSCPDLRNEAYFSVILDDQLESQAIQFINDSSKNKMFGNVIYLSKIFDWFEEDFTKNMTLIEFLNQYANVKLNNDAKIYYLDYDWGLNNQK